MDDRGAPALAAVTTRVYREPLEITGDLVGGVGPVLPRHGAVEVDLADLRPLERETPIERTGPWQRLAVVPDRDGKAHRTVPERGLEVRDLPQPFELVCECLLRCRTSRPRAVERRGDPPSRRRGAFRRSRP